MPTVLQLRSQGDEAANPQPRPRHALDQRLFAHGGILFGITLMAGKTGPTAYRWRLIMA